MNDSFSIGTSSMLIEEVGPIAFAFSIAFGYARALDLTRSQSCFIAAVAASLGLVALGLSMAVMKPFTAVQIARACFYVGWAFWFCAVPTIIAVFGIAALSPEVRAAWRADRLVDLRLLPAGLLAPVKPYLNGRRRHIRQLELEALFASHHKLVSASDRAYRQELAELEARSARDLAKARADFVMSLSDRDRALFSARLSARAEAEASRNGDEDRQAPSPEWRSHDGGIDGSEKRPQRFHQQIRHAQPI
jgi:hypothetical protein